MLFSKYKVWLEAPTISGKRLAAFGVTSNNSSGTATRDMYAYGGSGDTFKLLTTYTTPGRQMTPSMKYFTTGVGLSSSKKVPDETCRFCFAGNNNIIIYKLVLYYAKD